MTEKRELYVRLIQQGMSNGSVALLDGGWSARLAG